MGTVQDECIISAAAAAAVNGDGDQLQQPHVVIFPYDEHGHVTPAFALGRALASRGGIRVTGVLTASRFSTYTSAAAASGLFHVVPIPAHHSPSAAAAADDGSSIIKHEDVCYQQSLQRLQPGFEELMLRLQPRPSCLISDILFPWSQDVADRLGIPRFHIWVFPAIIPLLLFYTPALHAKGLLPFQPGTEEEVVDFIPGLPKAFRLGDVPVDFRWRDRRQLEFLFEIVKGMRRAAGAIINTVYELEPEVVQALEAETGLNVYTVGSMSSLQEVGYGGSSTVAVANGSHVKGKDECLQWLDTQARASVVYVALGSIVSLTEEEIQEMALGLEASGQPFLWVLRRPAATDPMSALPDGFLERTHESGRVIKWAPQTAVLAHPSVGCFLTHCGMGSLLEALSVGVPMIGGFCKISDQNTNLRLLSQEWGVAIPLQHPHVSPPLPLRSCVQASVKEVIHGDKGRELSRNALKLKATLSNAVQAPNGSSDLNLMKLVHAIINGCPQASSVSVRPSYARNIA